MGTKPDFRLLRIFHCFFFLQTVETNQRERDEERSREPDTIDGEMLWILWRHIRRTERRRRVGYLPINLIC